MEYLLSIFRSKFSSFFLRSSMSFNFVHSFFFFFFFYEYIFIIDVLTRCTGFDRKSRGADIIDIFFSI